MNRQDLINALSHRILAIDLTHPTRVGIDGIDASGKSQLAHALANHLKQSPRQIITSSIDHFHQPRAQRYQRGRLSPVGYYNDSFDYERFKTVLLEPLGPHGNLHYQTAAFDYRTDQAVAADVQTAQPDAILITDGIFLFRPELVNHWDLRIFVDIDFTVSLARGIERAVREDASLATREAELIEQYEKRYIPGQKLYFKIAKPQAQAHIIIANNDWQNPVIKKLADDA